MRNLSSSMSLLWTALFWLLLCATPLACSDDDQPFAADMSTPGDGGLADVLVDVDRALADAGVACSATVDLAPLTLGADYCAIARLEVPKSSAFAFSLAGDSPTYYSYEAGDGAREMVVRAFALDLAQNTLGAGSEHFGFEVSGEQDFYAGWYLARHGEQLAVGYTLADYSGDVISALPGAGARSTAAPGNFDAIYLDDGQLLVNGLGLDAETGQGVYALDPEGGVLKVISEMGDGSGFLARGSSVLYASYYDFTSGANKLYAFTLAEVRAALEANTALATGDGDLVYDGDLADISASGDELIVIDASFTEFRGVRALAATISADRVAVQSPVDIVSASGVADARTPTEVAVDGEVIALRLGSGDEAEIALIKKR